MILVLAYWPVNPAFQRTRSLSLPVPWVLVHVVRPFPQRGWCNSTPSLESWANLMNTQWVNPLRWEPFMADEDPEELQFHRQAVGPSWFFFPLSPSGEKPLCDD